MADNYVGVTDQPEGVGIKLLRMFQHLVGAKNVQSEAVVQCDPTDSAAAQAVKNAAPAATDYGAVVRVPEPASAALSSVAQNAATVALLAVNAARRGFVIVNEQPETEQGQWLHVAFAAVATLAAYTKRLAPGESWERQGGYTGAISGIWSGAGTGNARITEES